MKFIPSQTSPRLLLGLAGVSLLAISSSYAQLTIYADTYSNVTNNVALTGRTDFGAGGINITGAAYLTRTRGQILPSGNTTVGNPAPSANTGANGAAVLPLASGGSYIREANDSIFTISANLSIGNTTGSGTAPNAGTSTRGAELGFYSAPFVQGTNDANEGFTGFAFQNAGSNNAILQFVRNGVSTGFSNLSVLTGTLSTSAFYNLTYEVNTSTGNLTSASFNGTDILSSFSVSAAGAFTDAATAFAGFGASSTTGSTNSNFDNFSVTVIPEPSQVALLTIAGVFMMFVLRRRFSRAQP